MDKYRAKVNFVKVKVLVTGCAGFIGSHLCEKLVELGYEVIGVDAFTNYYSPRIKQYNISSLLQCDKFRLIELDLSQVSIDELMRIIGKVEYIIHEAAQPGVRASWGMNFDTYVKHNILATQRLLEAIARTGNVRRLVFASSSSVYGNQPRVPLREDMYLRPFSPYGVTKLASEALCITYYENFNVPIVILRYFTVYGPRQRPDMAFHRFIRAMLRGRAIEIYGDGSQMRDFTYVEDVVEATIRAMAYEDCVGEVINVGSSNPVKLIDVIKLLSDIMSIEPRIVFKEVQKGDVRVTYADISKARKILSWSPKTSLRDGLKAQVEWMKKAMEIGIL